MLEHGVVVGSAFCPQDVAALQYRAPRLAVDCLMQALPGPHHAALILDAACGTGLVAAEVRPPQTPIPPISPDVLKIPTTPAPDPHLPAQTHCFQTLGPHPLWGPLSSSRCGDPPGRWQV